VENGIAFFTLLIFGIPALFLVGLIIFVVAKFADWVDSPPWRGKKPTYPSVAESRGYKDVV